MKRTVATVLLVSAVAIPATLAAGGAIGLATVGTAASGPAVDPGGASRSGGDTQITYFSMAGRGPVNGQDELVDDHPGPRYVWASEPLELRATVRAEPKDRIRVACVRLLDADRDAVDTVGCTSWNSTSQWKRASHELSGWPAETRGPHVVRVELLEEVRSETASGDVETERVLRDAYETEVYVLSKQGDLDDDGLSNAREVEVGTDFTRQDTDGDGVSDRAEVFQYGSDPLAADSTGDGLEDGTIASFGLPPTVPYVVHGVAALALLGIGALTYAGVRLYRVLQTERGTPAYGATEAISAVVNVEADDGFPNTKEDEILSVLREQGGRMRQVDLVDETEWSKATVSRLLSTLEDEGRVEKIRVGRGNVVQLTRHGTALDDERSQVSG